MCFNRTIDIMRWQFLRQLLGTTKENNCWKFQKLKSRQEDFKICGSPRVLSIMTHVTSKICQICHYFHTHLHSLVNPWCCDAEHQVPGPIFFQRHGGLLFLKSETRLSDALIGTKTHNTLQTACKFRRVYSLKCDPISRVFALKNLREKNSLYCNLHKFKNNCRINQRDQNNLVKACRDA